MPVHGSRGVFPAPYPMYGFPGPAPGYMGPPPFQQPYPMHMMRPDRYPRGGMPFSPRRAGGFTPRGSRPPLPGQQPSRGGSPATRGRGSATTRASSDATKAEPSTDSAQDTEGAESSRGRGLQGRGARGGQRATAMGGRVFRGGRPFQGGNRPFRDRGYPMRNNRGFMRRPFSSYGRGRYNVGSYGRSMRGSVTGRVHSDARQTETGQEEPTRAEGEAAGKPAEGGDPTAPGSPPAQVVADAAESAAEAAVERDDEKDGVSPERQACSEDELGPAILGLDEVADGRFDDPAPVVKEDRVDRKHRGRRDDRKHHSSLRHRRDDADERRKRTALPTRGFADISRVDKRTSRGRYHHRTVNRVDHVPSKVSKSDVARRILRKHLMAPRRAPITQLSSRLPTKYRSVREPVRSSRTDSHLLRRSRDERPVVPSPGTRWRPPRADTREQRWPRSLIDKSREAPLSSSYSRHREVAGQRERSKADRHSRSRAHTRSGQPSTRHERHQLAPKPVAVGNILPPIMPVDQPMAYPPAMNQSRMMEVACLSGNGGMVTGFMSLPPPAQPFPTSTYSLAPLSTQKSSKRSRMDTSKKHHRASGRPKDLCSSSSSCRTHRAEPAVYNPANPTPAIAGYYQYADPPFPVPSFQAYPGTFSASGSADSRPQGVQSTPADNRHGRHNEMDSKSDHRYDSRKRYHQSGTSSGHGSSNRHMVAVDGSARDNRRMDGASASRSDKHNSDRYHSDKHHVSRNDSRAFGHLGSSHVHHKRRHNDSSSAHAERAPHRQYAEHLTGPDFPNHSSTDRHRSDAGRAVPARGRYEGRRGRISVHPPLTHRSRQNRSSQQHSSRDEGRYAERLTTPGQAERQPAGDAMGTKRSRRSPNREGQQKRHRAQFEFSGFPCETSTAPNTTLDELDSFDGPEESAATVEQLTAHSSRNKSSRYATVMTSFGMDTQAAEPTAGGYKGECSAADMSEIDFNPPSCDDRHARTGHNYEERNRRNR